MTRRLSRRQVLTTGAIVVGVAAASVASPLLFKEFQALTSTPHTAASGPLPWLKANRILANTVVPVFPNTSFVVTHSAYGAVGDGHTDNTAAFQKAIATCNAAGGGHVVVPAGTYVTGAIYLKSNVDLHLDPGATLMFSGDASRYPLVLTRYEGIECMNHSPMIYAFGEKNIALTGSGTLDASGTAPWNHGGNRAGVLEPLVARGVPPHRRNVAGKLRSSFVQPYNCDTVLIQGVTLRHALFWQLHPTLCRHVTVDGVTTHHWGCEQRRLRPRMLRPRGDQEQHAAGRRRHHRHQVGPGRRWSPGQRTHSERRHLEQPVRRPRGRDLSRQRDDRRHSERLHLQQLDGRQRYQARPLRENEDFVERLAQHADCLTEVADHSIGVAVCHKLAHPLSSLACCATSKWRTLR